MFSNIANYAYVPGSGKATVRFAFEEDPRAAAITFIDSGMPYNPLEKDAPEFSLNSEERDIGGLGIFLTRKTMDDIEYRLAELKARIREDLRYGHPLQLTARSPR